MAEPGLSLYPSARGRGRTEPRAPRLLRLLLWAGTAFQVTQGTGQELHACKESEYHYEYTACDSTGSRWRVAVPHTPGLCTSLPDPVKGTECSFSCNAGEFLDMKDQSCKPCAEGRYSLGTGIRFDEWDELPHGFANLATNMEMEDGVTESTENCTSSKWVPRGDYIASNTDECTATLMYAVNLKQSGTVNFEYYYPDSSIIFEFFVQNDQCQPNVDDSRWIKTTEKGWEIHSVELNRGNNVLYWRTTAFSVWSKAPKPVLVRNIAITGVAYTSECFPCKPGTYAAKQGSSFCKLCPANFYSNKGETSCHQCDPDKYSEKGSSTCKVRPACTDKDYFYTHTACDANGETQLMYKWAEPKICGEDLEGAVKLPASGVKTLCPPCNPGFFKTNNSTCEPCPYGSYSNGSDCTHCPAGTEPALGFEYKWWNTLPTNMETTVLSGVNFEYKGMTGWEVAGDYIYTAVGASDNDFMILTLVVPGFRPPQSVIADTENKEVARITFVFETICSVNCELYFMVGMNSRTNTPVETWKGSKGKQSYTYIIEKNATMSFTWAFQRTTFHEAGRKYTNDVAKLYSINVTNVMDGVASYCRPCALEASNTGSSCTSCPAGYYIDRDSGACHSCPSNTILKAHQPYGIQACTPCGPGTKSNKIHSLCYNDCSLSVSSSARTFDYNFSTLANPVSLAGGPSFTSKGLKYFHHFTLSLCGNQGKKMSVCTDNVTDLQIPEGESGFSKSITAYVCQMVIIPPEVTGYKAGVSSQPVSLADRLIGVTTDMTLDGITSPAELFPLESLGIPDVIFFYRSNDVTQSCSSGRSTTIRVRCNPLKPATGSLLLPVTCSDGTCDGCNFHFLWESMVACPLCSTADYHAIISSCVAGIQKTTYVWREPKLCWGGVSLPEQRVTICKTIDFWLKVGISAGTCTAILLTVLTCYFWKKNQKLEYKYSKLVMNATLKDCDLPAADSCAIMEGEDVEDDLIFTSKKSLFGKIKSFTSKRTPDGFDSVPLKTSSGGPDMDL
ncbi:endosome/lysosome-associated apoptosis and autophagy regulator 1 isoform X1 [Elephas maximus indicus]|uniref:endosome/lysosome-associated apoptosis and autophagy regulator 1 isoform X1 n=1 Tax=Elephas maximus indicus TaxID=99487 RepID=UPI0021161CE8|nr:endosome/lysosome-associated apoptosis and autophagy regulator 1 isoform X1 [Elephas maximus indicus]